MLKLLAVLIAIFAHGYSLAQSGLLKDEPAEKEILVPSSIPSIKEKCQCVQKLKTDVEAGNAKAIESVAFCHDPEEKNDCSKDPVTYANFLQAAATRGRLRAMFTLSMLYNFGGGVKKDPKLAADWWAQSARQNLPAGYFMLGQAYADGIGRPKSKDKALALLRQAQDMGYVRAKERIEELSEEK